MKLVIMKIFAILISLCGYLSSIERDSYNTEATSVGIEEQQGLLDSVNLTILLSNQTHIIVNVDYNLTEYNDLAVYGFYSDVFEHKTIFYKYSLYESENRPLEHFNLTIELPKEVFFYDHQNTSHPTNLYVHQLGIKAMLKIIDKEDNQTVVSIHGALENLWFPDPWDRPPLPCYSLSWELHIKNEIDQQKIPFCRILRDSTLFSDVLPLSGTNIGFTRKFNDNDWPPHILPHIRSRIEEEGEIKFTITLWLLLTKPCVEGGCMIFQARNTSYFHSPTILLNNDGYLHIQLHASDGSGDAYISTTQIPLHKWIFLMVTVDGMFSKLFYRFDNTTKSRTYSGFKTYTFGGSNSLAVVGGYSTSHSMTGYIAEVKLYHNVNLKFYETLMMSQDTLKKLQYMGLKSYHRRCSYISRELPHVFGTVIDSGHCHITNWWETECLNIQEPPKIRGRSPKDLEMMVKKNLFPKDFVLTNTSIYDESAEILHKMAVRALTKKALSEDVILRLLEVSGCLGIAESVYVTAAIHMYGVGVPCETEKAYKYQLIGSQMDHAMSHLSLAYRHLLQLHGMQQQHNLRAGYIRRAAQISKNMLDAEVHQVFTFSEMIRLDQAHSFRDVRGADSQLFQWLQQQAKMGSLQAKNQVADMLFHGRQGITADPQQAIRHFNDAADAGDPIAMYNLGVMHIKGSHGVEQNQTKAIQYLKKSIESNSSIALNVMGFIEMNFNKNRTGAAHYWKLAYELGDLQAMFNYAWLIENGGTHGNNSDPVKALGIYQEAAKKGERHSSMKMGDFYLEGVLVERNEKVAITYFTVLSSQLQDIGIYMRSAIDDYIKDRRYSSFIHHLLAMEGGCQLAGYNIALLLKEAGAEISDHVVVSNDVFYYNLTAELGWSISLTEMGHRNWDNETTREISSQYYSRAVAENNNPEALFNLGYIVENGYPLYHGIEMDGVKSTRQMKRNLSLAKVLYESCIQSTSENSEGFYPCHLALLNLKVKMFLRENSVEHEIWIVMFITITTVLSSVAAFLFRRNVTDETTYVENNRTVADHESEDKPENITQDEFTKEKTGDEMTMGSVPVDADCTEDANGTDSGVELEHQKESLDRTEVQ